MNDLLAEIEQLRARVSQLEHAEASLRHQQEELQLILDCVPATIWYKDAENRFLRVNRAASTLLQKPASEIEGRSGWDLFPDEADNYYQDDLDVIQSGQPKKGIVELLQSASGQKYWVSTDKVPYRNAQGEITGVVVFAVDITEQQQAKEILTRNAAYYRSLFEDSPISLWEEDFSEVRQYVETLRAAGITDFRAHFENHPASVEECARLVKVINLNYATVELYEANSKEDLLGGLGQVVEKSLHVFREELLSLIENKGRFYSEVNGCTLKHNPITTAMWLSVAPGYEDTWAKVFVSVIDILPRKQAESQLKRELQVNAALSALYKPLISSSSIEDISKTVLRQAQDLIGNQHGFVSTQDDLVGELVNFSLEDMPPDLEPAFLFSATDDTAFHTNSAASQGPFERLMVVPVTLNGKKVGQITLANPSRDFNDYDLDAVRRMAEFYALAVQRARDEKEREKLISDLDAFSHSAAHDLKNPLHVIMNVLDILMTQYANDETLAEYLKIADNSITKMNEIIDNLLLLAEINHQQVPTTLLDMDQILQDVQIHLSYMLQSFDGRLIIPTIWPTVIGYAPWIELVWVNYISNALKYGGSPPVIEVGATPLSDGLVRFWVRDNGPGIELESQSLLFKPFSRLSRSRGGYGLGLSIVQRIVEKLGGNVGVDSELGEGSTFSFTLPKFANHGSAH
ncbi:MAG TPA: ATP-binding protein [Aggregatilineaceae bacterium]|nr:ATP-binding protein [Aggregatilineaceae bacterium]